MEVIFQRPWKSFATRTRGFWIADRMPGGAVFGSRFDHRGSRTDPKNFLQVDRAPGPGRFHFFNTGVGFRDAAVESVTAAFKVLVPGMQFLGGANVWGGVKKRLTEHYRRSDFSIIQKKPRISPGVFFLPIYYRIVEKTMSPSCLSFSPSDNLTGADIHPPPAKCLSGDFFKTKNRSPASCSISLSLFTTEYSRVGLPSTNLET